MFNAENGYARARRNSKEKAHRELNLDAQRHWRVDEPGPTSSAFLPPRAAYAQNEIYLELCNPGWDMQWRAGFGNVGVVLPMLFVIWGWYGFAVHPIFFDHVLMLFKESRHVADAGDMLFGWILMFPLALGCMFMLYGWFFRMGMRTSFFTYLRGRVRFNRITRKVYVLRPKFCGGNKIFKWDQLVALMSRVPEYHPAASKVVGSLVLYQPPTDPDDWLTEDAVFAGPSLHVPQLQTAPMWEYIRLFMEEGPTIDHAPDSSSTGFRQIARYPAESYFTFCGMPSDEQYELEQKPGAFETIFLKMSLSTCSWPRFPKESQSDSGNGESEDNPVRAGAVMTALAYRAEGKLSAQDEVTLMARYGTAEGQAEARARLAREQGGGGES